MALLALFLLAQTAQAQDTNPTFGVIEAYEAPEAATELGVGWTRVRFPWAEVQPNSPDEWLQVHGTDEQIAAEIQAQREVIGLLIGIPQWARDEADLPKGLYLPHTDPNNLWANYVHAAVTSYAGQIDHWIIWNEPDIWDDTAVAYTWHGSEADFAQLMRVAYLTAKEANPEAVIHLSAMTFFWDNNFGRTQYLDLLLTELDKDPEAAANNYYFDIATAHLYFQPNQIFDILSIWNGILADHGLSNKPWWLAETNAPVVDDPSWVVDSITFNVTQLDQANFIPQGIAVAFASNVERISIFKLIDTESDRLANPEPFGLVRFDGSKRPAFTAYQTAIRVLTNVTGGERERWDEVGQVRLTHADGGQTHVLFIRSGPAQMVEIGALSDSAELITHMGERTAITATDGVFRVALPNGACSQPMGDGCMIGGDTFYLVQRPAQSEPTPIPTDGATATPFVPTLAAQNSTPQPTSTPLPAPTNEPLPALTPIPTTQPTTSETLSLPAIGAIILALLAVIVAYFVVRK